MLRNWCRSVHRSCYPSIRNYEPPLVIAFNCLQLLLIVSLFDRIIVGAPHGQAPGNSSRTGLVYTCPVTPGDCTVLTADQPDDPLHQSMFAGEKGVLCAMPTLGSSIDEIMTLISGLR